MIQISRELLVPDDPGLAEQLRYVAFWLRERGDHAAALQYWEEALTIHESRPDIISARKIADSRYWVIEALHHLGRDGPRQRRLIAEALAVYRDSDDDLALKDAGQLEAWRAELKRPRKRKKPKR